MNRIEASVRSPMPDKSLRKPQKLIRKQPLVLVIEDNEDNLSYATSILELSDYQFLKANNGRIGIDIAMEIGYPI